MWIFVSPDRPEVVINFMIFIFKTWKLTVIRCYMYMIFHCGWEPLLEKNFKKNVKNIRDLNRFNSLQNSDKIENIFCLNWLTNFFKFNLFPQKFKFDLFWGIYDLLEFLFLFLHKLNIIQMKWCQYMYIPLQKIFNVIK